MTLQGLAEENRLRTRRDPCGDRNILGRRGEIHEYGSGRFGVTVMGRSARMWGNARRELIAAGFQITQNADSEGTALFDPTNQTQLRLALKVIRARQRRQPSEAQLAVLRNGRKSLRRGGSTAPGRIAGAGDEVGAIPGCFEGKNPCGDGSSGLSASKC